MGFGHALSVVALLGYLLAALGPPGTVLCIGGDHDGGLAIAVSCSSDHSHSDHQSTLPACREAHASECGDEEHHGHDHGPCFDLRFDPLDARPASISKLANRYLADLPTTFDPPLAPKALLRCTAPVPRAPVDGFRASSPVLRI
ncbi:MAG: hypothetical protein AB7O52_10850 [Planctomycetota bacterium]